MTEAVLIEDEDTNDDDGNNTHIDSNVTGREPSIKASQLQAITTQPTKTTDTINNNASCFFDDSKWETITNELQNEQSTLNQCNDYKQTKNVFSDPNKPFDSGVRKPVVHQKVVKNLDESLPSFIRVSNTCDVDSTMKQDSTLPTKDDAGASDGVATESTKSTSHNKKLSKKLKEVEKTINEVRDILQALNKLVSQGVLDIFVVISFSRCIIIFLYYKPHYKQTKIKIKLFSNDLYMMMIIFINFSISLLT